MDILVIIKIVFLLLSVAYGYSNTVNAFRGNEVGNSQIWLMAIGIVGFIVIHFQLYLK